VVLMDVDVFHGVVQPLLKHSPRLLFLLQTLLQDRCSPEHNNREMSDNIKHTYISSGSQVCCYTCISFIPLCDGTACG